VSAEYSKAGGATIRWLGQAGFLIDVAGTRIAVDPYLSDECERIHGLVRVAPAPITPTGLSVDAIAVTHWHEDHFDLPTVEAARSKGCTIIAPPSVLARIRGMLGDGDDLLAIRPGETVPVGAVHIRATPAVHRVAGFLTEDAVGILIEAADQVIYHSGDTEYSRQIVDALNRHIDVALVCVNGSGGNMNVMEAAAFVAQLDVAKVVPMHVGMWADAAYGPGSTLDPLAFRDVCGRLGLPATVTVPRSGEDVG